jgi:tRNA(Ile)-lysidine synthetase-like protein
VISHFKYPKPKQTGGVLIRAIIKTLRNAGVRLPLSTDILIAISGGMDSVALAHLFVMYGRRVQVKDRIKLLHINHQWRGNESIQDQNYVESLGQEWGVPVITIKKNLKPNEKGVSAEEFARVGRKEIYNKLSKKYNAVVLTAHHLDDRFETQLWRLFTGNLDLVPEGILVKSGVELRPFLGVKKSELKRYLKEEGVSWREDSTNLTHVNALRTRLRLELIPNLLSIFPKADLHLEDLSNDVRTKMKRSGKVELDSDVKSILERLLVQIPGRKKRKHFEVLNGEKKISKTTLPNGLSISVKIVGNKTLVNFEKNPKNH